jgi:phospholipid/cholesterol/gamma-HCH transport system substrate-binding protein
MEIRARFVLIGVFVLAVIAAGFGFVYWMENSGGLAKRTAYRIQFDQSVSGLLLGSAVQFNGIRVGEVTALSLDRDNPQRVLVTIAVASDTPVRTDTEVGLVFGGLTGVPEIALAGGSASAPPPAASDGGLPLLVAPASTSVAWTDAARDAFARIDTLLAENSEALKDTIANLDTFSKALAKNSGSLDGIVAGLTRMTGGATKVPANAISLAAAANFPPLAQAPAGQLIVMRPSAPVALETPRILVEAPDGRIAAGFDDAQWADSAPLLLQAKLIESFENAGYLRVASDVAGLLADHQLLIELRAFQVEAGDRPTAIVDFTAKLADAGGNILSARRFQASAPVAAMEAAAAAAALSEAFDKAATDLVGWTLPLI